MGLGAPAWLLVFYLFNLHHCRDCYEDCCHVNGGCGGQAAVVVVVVVVMILTKCRMSLGLQVLRGIGKHIGCKRAGCSNGVCTPKLCIFDRQLSGGALAVVVSDVG